MKKMKQINHSKLLKGIFYFSFLCCIIFAIYLYVHPVQGISVMASYDTSATRFYTDFDGESVNYFVCDVDKLNSISVYLGKEADIKDFNVVLQDVDDKVIFERKFYDYQVGDIIVLTFPAIDDSMGKKYKLSIDSDDSFRIYTTLSKNHDNYLNNDKENTFIFTMSGYKNNYFYIWYPIMMLAILYPFYVMIGGNDDAKKSR